MRADAHVDAEQRSALDLVARAAAAVAAADAAGPGEPCCVSGVGAPSPKSSSLPALPCGPSAPARGSAFPAAALPAVTYDIPKTMGSSLGWTDDNRVPILNAYLKLSADLAHGTSRSKDDLWAAVHKVWDDQMRKKGPMRVEHNASALEKHFKRIRTGVGTFTSHYLSVKTMPTTGNLTGEDIISGAVARYCSLDVYDAIRTCREKDKRDEATRKRKAKLVHCNWVACWRVLRQSDKFSGAANLEILVTDFDTTSEKETGSGSGGGANKSNGGFQRRVGGVKAAKAARFADMQYEKQVQASSDAVANITAAQHERTAFCLF